MRRSENSFIMGVIFCIIALSSGFYGFPAWAAETPTGEPGAVTTFLVVRHADRDVAKDEDRLTPEGLVRAQDLCHVAGWSGVKAIYATNTERSRQTVAPLATRLKINPTEYPYPTDLKAFAKDLLSKHAGQVVLVIGHGDTVQDIVNALGGEGAGRYVGTEFDDLAVVTVASSGESNVLTLKYGTPLGETRCRPR